MGNYTILEHIICYMTDIDEEDVRDFHMDYCFANDEKL